MIFWWLILILSVAGLIFLIPFAFSAARMLTPREQVEINQCRIAPPQNIPALPQARLTLRECRRLATYRNPNYRAFF